MSVCMSQYRSPIVYREIPAVGTTAAPGQGEYRCDLCGRIHSGRPDSSGLFLWTRGKEIRYDEPPLCEECAKGLVLGVVTKWSLEDEEEG